MTLLVSRLQLLQSVARGLVLSALLLILTIAFVGYWQSKGVPAPLKAVTFIVLSVSVFIAYSLNKKHLNMTSSFWRRFSRVLIVLYSAITVVWVVSYASVLESDFGIYYRCGLAHKDGIQAIIAACHSKYLNQDAIFWSRSLFYTAPFGWLFGDNYFLLKLYNGILHIVTVIAFYCAVKRYFDYKITFVALLLLILNPEFWFTSTLTTTDNLALLGIVLFLFLAAEWLNNKVFSSYLIASVIVGFICVQLRSIAPLILLTLLLWAVSLPTKQFTIKALIYFLVMIVAWAAMGHILTSHFSYIKPANVNLLSSLTSISFSKQGYSYDDIYRWFESFSPAISDDWRTQVSITKALTEFAYNISALPNFLMQKTQILFEGTGYYGFSAYPFPKGNLDTFYNIGHGNIPWVPQLNVYFTSFMFVVVSLAILGILACDKKNHYCHINVVWILAVTGSLLLLGTVQARYILLAVPSLSLLAAIGFSSPSKQLQVNKNWFVNQKEIQYGITCMAVLILGCCVAAFWYKKQDYNPMLDLAKAADVGSNPEECDNANVLVNANYKELSLQIPNKGTCYQGTVSLPAGAKGVYFFVNQENKPTLTDDLSANFSFEIKLNGAVVLAKQASAKAAWYQVSVPATQKDQLLTLTVRKNSLEVSDMLKFYYMKVYR